MVAYLIKRILLIFPTLFGIMLISFAIVQFAPGGPVERVIAQLTGNDVGATSRISGGGDGITGAAPAATAGADINSKYRGAQGLDPEFIKELERQFGFDKPAHERAPSLDLQPDEARAPEPARDRHGDPPIASSAAAPHKRVGWIRALPCPEKRPGPRGRSRSFAPSIRAT